MNPFLEPLKRREFVLFWSATAISLIGDQMTFIAMPWLVLKVSGDPLVMGTVMAVAGIPRAVLMLVGGAITDTVSPRTILLWSMGARFVLITIVTVLTATGLISVWMIFVVAFLFGTADAFAFPAASTMPRRLLSEGELPAGNGLIQGAAQVTLAIGPLAAGALIALLGTSGQEVASTASDATGITDGAGLASAFALDAATFLIAISLMLWMRHIPAAGGDGSPVLSSIVTGLRYVWNDMPLRIIVLLFVAMGLVFRGPFAIGIPAFTEQALPQGAAAFGIIMSALGVGSIVGSIIGGSTQLPAERWLAPVMLVDFCLFASIMLLMTFVPSLPVIASATLLAAVLDGYVIIWAITWLQRRAQPELLGRVMSVVMLASQGLFPISAAAAGFLAGIDVVFMLRLGASLLMSLAFIGLLIPVVRRTGVPA